MPSISSLLTEIRGRLIPFSDTAGLDAQVILAQVLGVQRAWLLAHPEIELTQDQERRLQERLTRLESGEPLPYVLGRWEFFGLDFTINPAVLIPRPETELLVERALDWLRLHPRRRMIADIGTGSGCIAISLAVHIPDLKVIATDISPEALEVARFNADRQGVIDRVRFRQVDLLPDFADLGGNPFDLICANLPYIPTETLRALQVARREPLLALDGGPDGLDIIRRLLKQASQSLLPDGLLLMEIEASQGAPVLREARTVFPLARVRILPDLAGKDRLLEVALPIID